MQNMFFILFQALIICNGYIFTNALVGNNIRNATITEYPAVVCLMVIDPNRTALESIFCTGVFITESHVLSSQHCFDRIGNHNFRVIAEHPDVLEGREYFPSWWTSYDTWAQNANIPRTFNANDVAMLKINGETSRHILPSLISRISPHSLLFGSQVQVVGFGRTNTSPRAQILQTTDVYVLPNRQCEDKIRQLTGQNMLIYERYLCTAATPHVLLAEGDSGGPLYYQGLLLALNRATVSSVLPMDDPNRLNIHLGLQWYRDFINEHLYS